MGNERRGEGAVREDIWVPTSCDMCYNACSVRVRRVDGVAVQVEGIPGAPPNYGKMCAKGMSALMNLYSPNRIDRPLRRTNPRKGIGVDPGWEPIPYEAALDLIVQKLSEVRAKDPRRLVGATFDGHSRVPFWAFLTGFGTPNYTTVSAGFFCGNGVHPVAYQVTGSNDVHPDLKHTRYLMQFGTYFGFVAQYNAMGLAQEMAEARSRGMRHVVVDPMLSYPASQADEWVPIRPGTDAALALGMMNVLVNELGLYDREYLLKWTNATYLVGPDGLYLRGATGKPLVFDARLGQARPYDEVPPLDCALEGIYPVGETQGRPGFQLFRDHLKGYPPEKVAEVTTVPAQTVRRLAREFGEAAEIGGTIRMGGLDLPYRPAVATWYRGVSAHKHGMLNGMALAQLNLIVGGIDVPGGILNAAAAGPFWFPKEGPDGLLTSENPFTRHHRSPSAPARISPPQTMELVELFPLSVYARAMLWLGILEGEKFGVPYQPEMLIQCRTNLMATTADPQIMAEALSRIPFVLSFADHHNETTEFADLLMPDAHFLERQTGFTHNPYVHFRHVPTPGGDWTFSIQQPVVKPRGEARYWVAVLYEAATRMGIQGEVYAALNSLARLEGEARLDPRATYPFEEVLDKWMKGWCGEDHGLPYFKEHGYLRLKPRRVQESYPRPFHSGRIPLYLEHFLRAGRAVEAFTRERKIPWDTSDYLPLVEWKPCPSYEGSPPGFDLFLVNHKVPFLTFTFTAENPWLADLAQRNGRIFNIGIHPSAAKARGIGDGDPIALETPAGRKAYGVARLTEGIHPECVSVPAILGRWVTSQPQFRHGVHFNSLIQYTFDRLDTVSAALDACVRVKVSRAEGRV